jgi:drug/metabolite transporter (DMT)-like permease
VSPSAPAAAGEGRAAGLLALAGGVLCISFAGLFVKAAGLPPTAAGLHRLAGSALLLGLYVGLARPRPATPAPDQRTARVALLLLALGGAAFAADMALWNRCIQRVGPGAATLLANLQVFIVPLLGAALGRGLPHPAFWGAAALGIGGLALLVVPAGGAPALDPLGLALGLGAALTYSVYITFLGEGTRRWALGPPLTLLMTTGAGALTLLAVQGVELAIDPAAPVLARSPQAWLAVAGMCLVAQLGGWSLLLRGIARVGPAAAGVVLVGQSVLATAWDAVLLGALPSGRAAIGVGVVLLAIALGFPLAQPRPRAAG